MIWEKIKQRLGLASPANHYNADFYESYLNAFEKHDPSTLINDQSFVIFDTETTGLDPAKDHILSIGAVRVCHQSINISDSLSIIIMHDGIQNSNAAVIHPDSLDRKEYTLDKLCQRYHVVPKARHTADGDAFITALIFLKLLHRLHQKGIRIVSQLIR